MIQTIRDTLLQTPWWVYVLLIYLIRIGIRASKERVISFKKLLILPVIFTAMSVHTLVSSFQIDLSLGLSWLISIFLGGLVGYLLIRKHNIKVDRKNLLIQTPGTWITLVLVLIIFASKYYFGYELSVDPGLIKQTAFEFSMLFVSGVCTGLFIGRFTFYISLLYTRESVNLLA